ncbi:hypothetical protein D3C81_1576250 [compost metagenome]
MIPSNSAPPNASTALRVSAITLAGRNRRSDCRPTIHGQTNSSQKPIRGLSRFRYMENGTASSVKRSLPMARPLWKPGSQCSARASAKTMNRPWPK